MGTGSRVPKMRPGLRNVSEVLTKGPNVPVCSILLTLGVTSVLSGPLVAKSRSVMTLNFRDEQKSKVDSPRSTSRKDDLQLE